MNIDRWGSQATILLSDGRVLVFGDSFSKTAEIYDPATGTFSLTGNLVIPTGNPVGVRLADGRVLIVGGVDMNTFHTTKTAEIYDPNTGTFSLTGTMNNRSFYPTATLLQNGKVLIVGEEDGNKSEIYDPNTGTFSSQDTIAYHYHNTSTLLPNGKVLITGGATPYSPYVVNTAEIYDPITNTFSLTGSMLYARELHAAILLSSGKVLIAGGQNNDDGGIGPAELYDPVSGSFQLTGSLNESRGSLFSYPALNLLENGKVLIASGIYSNSTAELYDPDAINNVPPVVETISPSVNPVQISNSVIVNASFTDSNISDTHTASWNWGDGTTTNGTVTEANGSGSVSGAHNYIAAGIYTVTLTVTDNNGASGSSSYDSLAVYDPNAGFLTGSGSFDSQPGAYIPNPTATGQLKFNIQAKHKGNNTVPTGKIKLDFKTADFSFDSTSFQWLVINGNKAQMKGMGTINGSGNYTILITALDGVKKSGVDKIRIKITDSSNNVIYDNQPGDPDAADPTTPITKGSLKIH